METKAAFPVAWPITVGSGRHRYPQSGRIKANMKFFGNSQFRPKYLVKTFFGDTLFTSETANPMT